MKKVRFIAFITAVFMLAASCSAVMADGIADSFVSDSITLDEAQANASMCAWNNHLFVAGGKGLKIVDLQTGNTVASWDLRSSAVIPGLSSFVPQQVEVNDKYIVLTMANAVVVFPNEGSYNSIPPTMLYRFGNFGGVRKAVLDDELLYIFDFTAKNTLAAVNKEANHAVLWKVDLSRSDEFTYSNVKSRIVLLENANNLASGCSRLLTMGKYDAMWESVAVDDSMAYIAVYNNTTNVPFKTVFCKAVDLENFEVTGETEAYSSFATGLVAKLESKNEFKISDFADYKITNEDGSASLRIGDLKSYAKLSSNKMTDGTYKLDLYLTNLTVIKAVFGGSDSDYQNNRIKLKMTFEDKEYTFGYATNNALYTTGDVAAKNGYVYLLTNNASSNDKTNKFMVVDASDKYDIKGISERETSKIANASGSQAIYCLDDSLISLYGTIKYVGAVYDISNPRDIPYNFSQTLNLPAGIAVSTYSNIVRNRNRLYYMSTDNKTIYAIKIDGWEDVKTYNRNGYLPVKFYGSGSGSVTFSLNGLARDIECENELFNEGIYMAPSGSYTVGINGSEYTADINVPQIIEYENPDLTGGVFTAEVINNTAYYGASMKTTDLKVYAAAYNNGAFKAVEEADVRDEISVDFGEEVDEVRLYAVNNDIDMIPLGGAVVYKNGSLKTEAPVIFGKSDEITVSANVDAIGEKLNISGVSNVGGRNTLITVYKSGTLVYATEAECGEDGKFSAVYDYSDDPIASETAYTVYAGTFATMNADTITVPATKEIEEALEEIKTTVNTGAELREYAENNEEIKKALGIDETLESFKSLSSSEKEKVYAAILSKIKSGNTTDIYSVFKSESDKLYEANRKTEALKAVNETTVATLKGVLEKYKDVFAVSDELWKEYTESGKDFEDITRYFVKKCLPVKSTQEVADKLSEAIRKGPDYYSEDKGGGISSGGGGTGGKITSPEYTVPAVPGNSGIVENTNAPEVTFTDIDSVPWAKDSIIKLAKAGIVSGIGDNMYAPDREVTREEFTKMLVMLFGLEDSSAVCPFKDVDSAAWYYRYVASAYKNGIAKGYDGIFGIGSSLTREEMTVLTLRCAKAARIELKAAEETVDYTDSDEISDWAKDSVEEMQKAGIINGVSDKMFAPKTPCTRAMAAKVVYTLLQQM